MIAETGKRIPLEDGDAVEGSEFTANSLIIADAVMKSLSSSLTASHVLGATGSSESRKNFISPPPGSVWHRQSEVPLALRRQEEQGTVGQRVVTSSSNVGQTSNAPTLLSGQIRSVAWLL